ncbi:glycosyltransferase family 87 protein [Hyphococcus sp.]|uniref:glycosyltransferase family 87 protein n=1 Tax=Hyphococcus sp. TaxID=2038636 RepID=UPI003CCC29D5
MSMKSLLHRADFRLTRRQMQLGAGAVGLSLLSVFTFQTVFSDNLITPAGTPVGGDFAAFWTAANAMAAGEGAAIYYPGVFFDWLHRLAPAQADWRLTWQYPPAYFFVIAFLAALPYGLGYAVWTGGGIAVLAGAARCNEVRSGALLVMLAAPVVFHAAITGQTGFLTASLFLGATLQVHKRPMLAGLCAAFLTMKPQLGLLLPVAYAAGGHWRAFIAAGAGAAVLHGASLAVFGLDAWEAFFDSLRAMDEYIRDGLTPLYKMPTIYAAALMAGAPPLAAASLQGISALSAAAATALVWRRSEDAALKAAVVCCGAFLAAPYAYYYDFAIMLAPLTLLALNQARKGWRPYDQLMLVALFLAPLALPGAARQTGLNVAVFIPLLAFAFVLRRAPASTNLT